jgi:hypothetical protein
MKLTGFKGVKNTKSYGSTMMFDKSKVNYRIGRTTRGMAGVHM